MLFAYAAMQLSDTLRLRYHAAVPEWAQRSAAVYITFLLSGIYRLLLLSQSRKLSSGRELVHDTVGFWPEASRV